MVGLGYPLGEGIKNNQRPYALIDAQNCTFLPDFVSWHIRNNSPLPPKKSKSYFVIFLIPNIVNFDSPPPHKNYQINLPYFIKMCSLLNIDQQIFENLNGQNGTPDRKKTLISPF